MPVVSTRLALIRAVSARLAVLLAIALIFSAAMPTAWADGPEISAQASSAAASGLTRQGVAIGLAADSASSSQGDPSSAIAPVIRSVGCAPLLATKSQTITCIAIVDGPVSSYRWDAPGGYPPSGSGDVFFTSFGSHANWQIRLTVCRSVCVDATETVTVAEPSIYSGRLSVDRGPGGTYAPGDPIAICHLLWPQHDYTLKLFKKTYYGTEYQIAQVVDDGTGDCFNFLVSPENGPRRYRAEFYIGGDLVATASVTINVLGTGACVVLFQMNPGDNGVALSPACTLFIGESILIDQEMMTIVGRQGSVYFVTRTTQAAVHLAGTPVTSYARPGYP